MATHPFIPVDNVARVELIYTFQGQIVENVLHYHRINWNESQLTDLTTALYNWFDTQVQAYLSDAVSFYRCKATDLTTESSPGVDVNFAVPLAGSITTSDPMPNNCAALIRFTTGKRGRSYRGRMFLPGIVEVEVDNNQILEANHANIVTFVQGLAGFNIQGQQAELGVVSLYHNGAWRTTGEWNKVLNISVAYQVATIRRRMPGYGR